MAIYHASTATSRKHMCHWLRRRPPVTGGSGIPGQAQAGGVDRQAPAGCPPGPLQVLVRTAAREQSWNRPVLANGNLSHIFGALGGGCFAKQSFPCPLKAIDVLLFHFVVTGEDGVNPGQPASEQVVQRICTSLFESFAMGFSRALCDPPWVLRAERLGHHAQCAPKR